MLVIIDKLNFALVTLTHKNLTLDRPINQQLALLLGNPVITFNCAVTALNHL